MQILLMLLFVAPLYAQHKYPMSQETLAECRAQQAAHPPFTGQWTKTEIAQAKAEQKEDGENWDDYKRRDKLWRKYRQGPEPKRPLRWADIHYRQQHPEQWSFTENGWRQTGATTSASQNVVVEHYPSQIDNMSCGRAVQETFLIDPDERTEPKVKIEVDADAGGDRASDPKYADLWNELYQWEYQNYYKNTDDDGALLMKFNARMSGDAYGPTWKNLTPASRAGWFNYLSPKIDWEPIKKWSNQENYKRNERIQRRELENHWEYELNGR